LAAKGKGKPFTVPTEQVLSKISQPALRAAVARLTDERLASATTNK
jgi:hypothetical protein